MSKVNYKEGDKVQYISHVPEKGIVKGIAGEAWALEALDCQIYDRYDMVMKKAKEEGFV